MSYLFPVYHNLTACGWEFRRAAPTKGRANAGWYKRGICVRNYEQAARIEFVVGFKRYAAREAYSHFYD